MATHDIEILVPPKAILSSDVTFVIKSDGTKLGELRISRGSLDWVPAKHQAAYRLGWERFDNLMRTEGRRKK
jgi:hypothetical protein